MKLKDKTRFPPGGWVRYKDSTGGPFSATKPFSSIWEALNYIRKHRKKMMRHA